MITIILHYYNYFIWSRHYFVKFLLRTWMKYSCRVGRSPGQGLWRQAQTRLNQSGPACESRHQLRLSHYTRPGRATYMECRTTTSLSVSTGAFCVAKKASVMRGKSQIPLILTNDRCFPYLRGGKYITTVFLWGCRHWLHKSVSPHVQRATAVGQDST